MGAMKCGVSDTMSMSFSIMSARGAVSVIVVMSGLAVGEGLGDAKSAAGPKDAGADASGGTMPASQVGICVSSGVRAACLSEKSLRSKLG